MTHWRKSTQQEVQQLLRPDASRFFKNEEPHGWFMSSGPKKKPSTEIEFGTDQSIFQLGPGQVANVSGEDKQLRLKRGPFGARKVEER